MPAYNEEATILASLKKAASINIGKIEKEIIVINDGSKDNTRKILSSIKDKRIKVINKRINQGKGAGIRDAIKIASGDVLVIQDADLEYNPNEIVKLIKSINDGLADVVYGSRFMGGEVHHVLFFWHMVGNKFLTFLSNALTNLDLTDMETCYKMFTKDVAHKLDLKENRFGFEPEFTVKVSKMRARVYEMGISYSGRNYKEGKKIGWKDGLWAIWCLIKYGVLE